MSSGLRIRAPQDPDYDPSGPYPDHLYLYTGGVDPYHYAATRPQQWPPNTVGRYRNTDPPSLRQSLNAGSSVYAKSSAFSLGVLGHILRIILRLAIVRGNLVLPRIREFSGRTDRTSAPVGESSCHGSNRH